MSTSVLTGPHLSPKSGTRPKNLVLFLHGYGSNGDDLLELGKQWSTTLPATEFFAPNGIETCEINALGYQWFGLRDFSPFNMRAGLDKIRPILTEQIKNILKEKNLTPAQLAIVGFSQGTMVALDLLFTLPGLRAVVGYSGAFYPPVAEKITPPYASVFMAHGDMDMVVPYTAFTQAQQQLALFGLSPQTHTSRGVGHSIDAESIFLGGQFLKKAFDKTESQ